ncbi:hypothetical protein EON66_02980 [archaeon]|nr:MAG: hypothetical protein EON66_02980 [archaeon]
MQLYGDNASVLLIHAVQPVCKQTADISSLLAAATAFRCIKTPTLPSLYCSTLLAVRVCCVCQAPTASRSSGG